MSEPTSQKPARRRGRIFPEITISPEELAKQKAEDEAFYQLPVNSTGRSLLEHLKTIGKWEGDDLQDCIRLVIATRGKAKFSCVRPFK